MIGGPSKAYLDAVTIRRMGSGQKKNSSLSHKCCVVLPSLNFEATSLIL